MRILLIDDDSSVSELVTTILTRHSHVVDCATNAEEGSGLLQLFPYDLVILDIMLPKADGISFCRKLREHKNNILILLLTAYEDQAHRIIGLDAGADDYMTKPFDPEELIARIRALQRRGNSSSPVLEIGQLKLDPAQRKVTYANQVLNFRPKEYALLELLLRHPQRVFSRREILDRLWSAEDEPPDEATIKAHIKGIRHVLRAVGAEHLISTLYGQGYSVNPDFLPAEMPSPVPTQAIVSDIWDQVKFLNFERITTLQQALAHQKTMPLSTHQRAEAAQMAHRLVGALGIFGFPEGSKLARQLEQFFQSETDVNPDQLQQAEQWLADLEDQIQHPSKKVQHPDLGAAIEVPASPEPIQTIAKVLAIDDDIAFLKLLQGLMLPFGVEIIPLSSPRQLWQTLTQIQPDLILLDVLMPEVNGVDVCRAIRNHDHWQWVPIVFLTICQDADLPLRVFEIGADDFLSKPSAPSILATRILNRITRFKSAQRSVQMQTAIVEQVECA